METLFTLYSVAIEQLKQTDRQLKANSAQEKKIESLLDRVAFAL